MYRLILFFLIAWTCCCGAFAEKFLPDDPLREDPDCQSMAEPAEVEFSKTYDLLQNSFGHPGNDTPTRAANINTLGEVPNSSWFTNRLDSLSDDELLRGPNTGSGPDSSEQWTIISAKHEGVTPGFVLQDAKGDTYFIKFDPKGYPQMSTSTEFVATKFFYAFGYNVPENYLTFVDRKKLIISPDAMMVVDKTTRRRMKKKDIDLIFRRIASLPDGRVQAVASRLVPGNVVGTFRFDGTRTDDPNDVFPHEDRRELRGLRIFSAWLNHDELQTFNTLDSYDENGSKCIQHYLIDFNSTFGSANIKPQDPKSGNEYFYEGKPVRKAAYTIGLWDRSWRHVHYPKYRSVGRFESSYFQPEKWKPEYPNTAFDKMQNEDAFWAAKIVLKFTDGKIRALVRTGQYVDPEAEQYIVKTLIERRDKIVRYYFAQLNPLDGFTVTNDAGKKDLTFQNLGIQAGLASSASYQYQWLRFDNKRNTSEPIGAMATTANSVITIPEDSSEYLLVRIQTRSDAQPGWEKPVEVYLHNQGALSVVGIDRQN